MQFGEHARTEGLLTQISLILDGRENQKHLVELIIPPTKMNHLMILESKNEYITLFRTDVENYDIEELYEFADNTGILERHRQLLSKPFHESQV